jgi:hypothetical protein
LSSAMPTIVDPAPCPNVHRARRSPLRPRIEGLYTSVVCNRHLCVTTAATYGLLSAAVLHPRPGDAQGSKHETAPGLVGVNLLKVPSARRWCRQAPRL